MTHFACETNEGMIIMLAKGVLMQNTQLKVFERSFPELYRLTKQYVWYTRFLQHSEWLVDMAMLAIGMLLAVYAFPFGWWSLESGFWLGIPISVFIAGVVPWFLLYARRRARRVCRRSLPILVIFWTYWPKNGVADVHGSASELLQMFGIDADQVFEQVVDARVFTLWFVQSLPAKIRLECVRSMSAAT